MKAILLSAGLGLRLRPITENLPKCLVCINDKPMLQHWIEKLVPLGVEEFLINTHHLSKTVENFVNEYDGPAKLRLVYEEVLVGTAGTLLEHRSFVDTDCFLVHTDTFIEDNLQDFVTFHRAEDQFLFSAVAFAVNDPRFFGTFTFNDAKVMKKFFEKNPESPSRTASAACFLMRPALVEWIQAVTPFARDFSADILVKAEGLGRIYETSKAVFDIGTIENLTTCDRYVRSLQFRQREKKEFSD